MTSYKCFYCGAEFLEHKVNCPNCGALIKAAPVESGAGSGLQGAAKLIRDICIRYEDTRGLHLDETIKPKRAKTVGERFSIPTDDVLIMVYDDTLLGSNKTGFAICRNGLYWRNDWTTATRRNYLAWADFAERPITLDQFVIDLGRGDKIGTAGIGDDHARQQITAMLNEIKTLLKGGLPA